MEFLENHINEILVGSSGTIGAAVIGFLKRFGSRLKNIDDRLSQLEQDLKVNTALDKERAKK